MTAYQVLLLLGSYLVGSIPVGYLIVREKKGIDIRTKGSGVTGATNVSRELGNTWGRIVAILDGLKGFLASAVAIFFFWSDLWIVGLTILVVVSGHVFPVWLKFKGGKGVATFIGSLLPVLVFYFASFHHPWTYTGFAVILIGFIVVHKLRRMMGLSSISLMVLIILYFFGVSLYSQLFIFTIFIVLTALFIIYNHRENLVRIWNGKEPAKGGIV